MVIVMQVECDGALSSNADNGVVCARAVVVPAVNGHRHARFNNLDALQLQIVLNQAGRYGRYPGLNDQRGKWIDLHRDELFYFIYICT